MPHRVFIGQCDLDLHIEASQSLKDKRRVILSLKEKLKNNFNVAVCEFGDLSMWQRTQLGIATCGNDRVVVDSTLKAVLEYLHRIHSIAVLDFKIQII